MKLRDVYDEGKTIEVKAEVAYDGVFVKGDGWAVIVENREGTPTVAIWNRESDNDPDMVVSLSRHGTFKRMAEVRL
jgi:hypothetical protein